MGGEAVPDLCRGEVSVARDQPLAVDGSDEALGDAAVFGGADEGGVGLRAEEGKLALEVAAHLPGAVIRIESPTATASRTVPKRVRMRSALEDGFEDLETVGAPNQSVVGGGLRNRVLGVC